LKKIKTHRHKKKRKTKSKTTAKRRRLKKMKRRMCLQVTARSLKTIVISSQRQMKMIQGVVWYHY